jgi:hypothetical protein
MARSDRPAQAGPLRSALPPLSLLHWTQITNNTSRIHHCYAGHRHRDVPHASLERHGPETIPPDPAPVAAAPNTPEAPPDAESWRRWPRPPGSFIDLGCGNGLLTHILISEGYAGYGFDLRARTSWTHYPQVTQSHLFVGVLDSTAPTRVLPTKHHQQNRDPISSSPNLPTQVILTTAAAAAATAVWRTRTSFYPLVAS